LIQSLYKNGEVSDIIDGYGMVICDECHHIAAFSFETVFHEVKSKYVYGLTATPERSDGHQPIIFMQFGKIRYKSGADKHEFKHILVLRFTEYRPDKELSITEHYKALCKSEYRNRLIADDVIAAIKAGRNPIVISEWKSHIEVLREMLKNEADHVMILSGSGTSKDKKELLENLKSFSDNESIILLATGKYVGEGFDEPRLDTLFLAMPISWKGTLSQYAGRLNRDYCGKTSVMIYDYVDINVPMLENMYKKRLSGYKRLGYTIAEKTAEDSKSI
jgi:superfamily II DNA or RNA helicase